MIKKILINGSKIQAKYDGFNDGEVFTNKFYKMLEKQGFNLNKIHFLCGKDFKESYVKDFNGLCETIASKNLPMVYLNQDKNIIIENDWETFELLNYNI